MKITVLHTWVSPQCDNTTCAASCTVQRNTRSGQIRFHSVSLRNLTWREWFMYNVQQKTMHMQGYQVLHTISHASVYCYYIPICLRQSPTGVISLALWIVLAGQSFKQAAHSESLDEDKIIASYNLTRGAPKVGKGSPGCSPLNPQNRNLKNTFCRY
jgi:hypothetical protein